MQRIDISKVRRAEEELRGDMSEFICNKKIAAMPGNCSHTLPGVLLLDVSVNGLQIGHF